MEKQVQELENKVKCLMQKQADLQADNISEIQKLTKMNDKLESKLRENVTTANTLSNEN